MADDIVVRYRADVSGLRADLNDVVNVFQQTDAAGVASAQNIGRAFTEQNKSLVALQKTIQQMSALRDKTNDPAKVEQYNRAIAQQSALYIKMTQSIAAKNEFEKNSIANSNAVAAAQQKQITQIEYYRQSIQKLQAMMDKMNATRVGGELTVPAEKYQRVVEQLQKYNGLLDLARLKENTGVGLIENMRKRIETLTIARDKSNDPAKIDRYNKLLEQQGKYLDALTGGEKIKEQSPAVQALTSGVKKLGGAIVAAFATDKIIEFGTACVMEFGKAEQGAIKLNASISANGGTGEQMDMLIEQAEQLSSKTIFSSGQIKEVQTMASQFGLLPNDIEKLMPIIVDFASATGQDLQSAFTAVAGAINGNARAMSVYGVSLQEGKSKQENFISITEQLTQKFAGQGQALTQSTLGSLSQLSNAWDDIKEKIGGAIAPAVVAIANFATGKLNAAKAVETVTNKVETERTALNALVFQLMGAKEGTRQRKDLIDQLNARYPNFLANLNQEKLTNQILAGRLEEVNKQYLAKAVLAGAQKKIDDAAKKSEEAYDAWYMSKGRIAEIAAQKGLTNRIDLTASAYQQGLQLQKLLQQEKSQTLAGAGGQYGVVAKQIEAIDDLLDEVAEKTETARTADQQFAAAKKELNDAIKGQADKTKEFGGQLGEQADATVDYSKKTKKELEDIIKLTPGNTFAQDALDKVIEAEQKAADKKQEAQDRANQKAQADADAAKQKREQALQSLQQMEEQYNNNRLMGLAKTELDALEIVRASEIKKAQILFQATGGKIDATGNAVGNLDAVSAYNNAVASINAATDEKIKQNKIKSAQETETFLRALSDDVAADELQASIDNVDIIAQQQIIALKTQYNEKGVFTTAAETELQNKILAIEVDTQKQKIEIQKRGALDAMKIQTDRIDTDTQKLKQAEIDAFTQRGDNSTDAQKRLSERLTDIDKKAGEQKLKVQTETNQAVEKLERDLTKIQTDEQGKRLENATENAKTTAQTQLDFAREVTDKSIELAGELFNVTNALFEGRIQNLEFEKEAVSEKYDSDTEALQKQLDDRLITESQFNERKKALDDKKAADEKAIQNKINAEKRKQDIANRARAIFEIGVNTAVAIIRLWRDPGAPTALPLSILVGALGAAQLAAVLAQPLPKYKRGTKYLRRMNGEPIGDDTIPIFADEGERIVPRKQNIRHWKIYESLDNGTFERLMHDKFVAPALIKQRRDFEQQREMEFGNNIAKSIVMNTTSTTQNVSTDESISLYEFTRLWKKGIRISNIDELKLNNAQWKSAYTR